MKFGPKGERYTFPSTVDFPPAPASRLRLCLHTLKDGRIPLVSDWSRVLSSLLSHPHLYVQVEHAYGKMSVRMDREHYIDSLLGNASASFLQTAPKFAGWQDAWARLKVCDCCGSAGSISVHNSHGQRFLQVTPSSGTKLESWAKLLSSIAVMPEAKTAEPTQNPVGLGYLVLPEDAMDLTLSKRAFLKLLVAMSTAGEMLQFTMPGPEACLHQSFVLEALHEEDGYLYGRGNHVGFTFNLAGVRGFAQVVTESGSKLLLVGPGESVLFEVSPMPGSAESADWHR